MILTPWGECGREAVETKEYYDTRHGEKQERLVLMPRLKYNLQKWNVGEIAKTYSAKLWCKNTKWTFTSVNITRPSLTRTHRGALMCYVMINIQNRSRINLRPLMPTLPWDKTMAGTLQHQLLIQLHHCISKADTVEIKEALTQGPTETSPEVTASSSQEDRTPMILQNDSRRCQHSSNKNICRRRR